MIGYITLGTNNLERAERFYNVLLKELGATQTFKTGSSVSWGFGEKRPMLTITQPFDRKPASAGNGVMVALMAKSRYVVDSFHAKALALGGKDEGAPDFRGDDFYVGYFRDLDGNKLNIFCYPCA
ncbi:glyoxalase family protein [Synechococcus sp. PCC 7335]|uniref:VOC family protein n=1 Tax=Synechococcus sp. (strain ATCC 29403 / PCC 7335) TaxID=91464 RepID=UPI00017EE824|nr:VOC family protein [Synechococcus sp. PCC 7335]EDX83434.1 glyoxalase family protein [Synechococcus sp. PCC 7335]